MAAAYLNIPELITSGSGGRTGTGFPLSKTCRLRRVCGPWVDTSDFRRLAHISQLGLVWPVYPGARHSRFEHALGVYHNALRYLWQLGQDPRFTARVDEHTAELLIVSALLHDLGHWPFCHPIEDLGLPSLILHEEFAANHLGSEFGNCSSAPSGIGNFSG